MWLFVTIPFLLQAIAILFDEFYFHHQRGLPKWERIGHPLDTLSFFACMLFVLLVPYSYDALKVFGILALISCLMVTKDEFVHKHHCPGAEHWLHAVLFLLHPITLFCTAVIWREVSLHWFLYIQAALMALFCLYQIIFWNFIWKSTTDSTTH